MTTYFIHLFLTPYYRERITHQEANKARLGNLYQPAVSSALFRDINRKHRFDALPRCQGCHHFDVRQESKNRKSSHPALMPRRSSTDPGSVFEVTLDDGALSYGIVVEFPLVAFFDLRASDRPSLENILSSEVLFRIWIMRSALGKNGWPVIGCASVPPHLTATPTFYKFDSIARKFSLYSSGTETPATREQCLPLECASVWSASHVEERLSDYFAGRPSRWIESLSAASRS